MQRTYERGFQLVVVVIALSAWNIRRRGISTDFDFLSTATKADPAPVGTTEQAPRCLFKRNYSRRKSNTQCRLEKFPGRGRDMVMVLHYFRLINSYEAIVRTKFFKRPNIASVVCSACAAIYRRTSNIAKSY